MWCAWSLIGGKSSVWKLSALESQYNINIYPRVGFIDARKACMNMIWLVSWCAQVLLIYWLTLLYPSLNCWQPCLEMSQTINPTPHSLFCSVCHMGFCCGPVFIYLLFYQGVLLFLCLVCHWTCSQQAVEGKGNRVWVPCNQWNTIPTRSASQHQAQIELHAHTHTHNKVGWCCSQTLRPGRDDLRVLSNSRGLLAKVITQRMCTNVHKRRCRARERRASLSPRQSSLFQPSHILPS